MSAISATAPSLVFDHGATSVPDLKAAIAWYGRVLGFEVARQFSLGHAGASCAMLQRGDLRIELFQPDVGVALPEARRHPDSDLQLHGNKHVAFRTDDFPGLLSWLTAQGADIAHQAEGPFGSAVFVRDPAGNLIEVLSRPTPDEAAVP